MRRFFVDPDVITGAEVALPKELSRRLATVLRLERSEHIILADGTGRDYEVELTSVSVRSVAGTVVSEQPSPPQPAVRLELYQSLIRPQRFEIVLEKATEIGVSRFVPLLSGRGQVKTGGGSQRARRWQRIVTEAAEQCGRGRVPVVDPPTVFGEAISAASGLRLLPWEGERTQGLRSALRSLDEIPERVSLLIGPEGGFAGDEVARARDAGWVSVSLGSRVLRSETAGIVSAAVVMHELGELGG